MACRVLSQHRSTQCKARHRPDDEAALILAAVDLAKQHGRYGYRRITALLRADGWQCNHKRVSYDFVEDRTRDGRKLGSADMIDVLAGLFINRGTPGFIRSDNSPEFAATSCCRARCSTRWPRHRC